MNIKTEVKISLSDYIGKTGDNTKDAGDYAGDLFDLLMKADEKVLLYFDDYESVPVEFLKSALMLVELLHRRISRVLAASKILESSVATNN